MHLVYPENFAFCFQFLLDITVIYLKRNIEYWKECLCKILGANKVHYGLCENSESVDFHNDIIMHLLDFEVAQNLDDTAPKK